MIIGQVAALAKQVQELEQANKALMKDLDHANQCWQLCAGQLRKARAKNRQLWEKMTAR